MRDRTDCFFYLFLDPPILLEIVPIWVFRCLKWFESGFKGVLNTILRNFEPFSKVKKKVKKTSLNSPQHTTHLTTLNGILVNKWTSMTLGPGCPAYDKLYWTHNYFQNGTVMKFPLFSSSGGMDKLFTGSEHAKSYAQYRPTYPEEVISEIINYCKQW